MRDKVCFIRRNSNCCRMYWKQKMIVWVSNAWIINNVRDFSNGKWRQRRDKSVKWNQPTINIHESYIVWSIKTSWTIDNWNGFNGLNVSSDGRTSFAPHWMKLFIQEFHRFLTDFIVQSSHHYVVKSNTQVKGSNIIICDLWQIQSLHWFYLVSFARCRWLVKPFWRVYHYVHKSLLIQINEKKKILIWSCCQEHTNHINIWVHFEFNGMCDLTAMK